MDDLDKKQKGLDLILYRDSKRKYLSSEDKDVLEIFEGNRRDAMQGIVDFYYRHEYSNPVESGKVEMVMNNKHQVSVKVFDLFFEHKKRLE
jgi:hypothetical protein